ncbi:hypothetical protein [Streptomyces sp. NPDC020983]|uniref:hypothetical protein n=1 Tax=Streptomyces sp. NPDC020983 TaxID=3365106 RepID=UPI00378B40E8
MQNNDSTTYNYTLTMHRAATQGQEAVYENVGFVFTTACGMTDEVALALAAAFANLTLPQGIDVQAWVTKHQITEIVTEGDLPDTTFV